MNKEDEIDKLIQDELSEETKDEGMYLADFDADDIDTQIEAIENKYAALDIEVSDEEAQIEAEIEADVAAKIQEKCDLENDQSSEEYEDMGIEWVPTTNKKKKKSKKSDYIYNVVRYVVMSISLVVFGYAAYELTLIYVESREAEELKSSTADMFYVSLDDLQEKYEPSTNAEGETISLENENDGKLFVFDYKKMLSYNSHSKGYIRQGDGEYIDNPIVQHPTDNEYYLTHLADHRKSAVGAIYIDTAIEEGLNAKNCIIYGHNIGDRAGRIMFGSLNWYYNTKDYYKEHPTFDIWIEDKRYVYYVFAIYKTEAIGSPIYQYSFSSDEEFMEYIDMCKKKSRYKFDMAPEITADSNIITLSTCTHTDELRMIVQLVRGEELDIYGCPVETEETGEKGTEK